MKLSCTPPTSDTIVLSGGTLLTDPPIADAGVVISNGVLVAFGPRTEVDMPHDSAGFAMRGKWLQPTAPLVVGEPPNLNILIDDPSASEATVYATVADGELAVQERDDL